MFLSFSLLSYKKSEYGLFIEINVYRKVSRALMFVISNVSAFALLETCNVCISRYRDTKCSWIGCLYV